MQCMWLYWQAWRRTSEGPSCLHNKACSAHVRMQGIKQSCTRTRTSTRSCLAPDMQPVTQLGRLCHLVPLSRLSAANESRFKPTHTQRSTIIALQVYCKLLPAVPSRTGLQTLQNCPAVVDDTKSPRSRSELRPVLRIQSTLEGRSTSCTLDHMLVCIETTCVQRKTECCKCTIQCCMNSIIMHTTFRKHTVLQAEIKTAENIACSALPLAAPLSICLTSGEIFAIDAIGL